MPLGHSLRPLVAWYGDMSLADHLYQFLRLCNLTVVVRLHDPVTIDQFGSRKALTDHCYTMGNEGVTVALTRRPDATAAKQSVRASPCGRAFQSLLFSAAPGFFKN